MSEVVRTRFAPSPTGFMHIGNLRTALYSYLIARAGHGQFILRIEDTDQERLVPGAVDVILKTLKMTGLDYDEGPDIGGPNGPYIQSERKPIYQKYAKELVDKGYAYYCFCSEERLKSLHDANGIGGYDRHCRWLSREEVEAHLKNGDPYVIRQKIPLEGTTTYHDEVFGDISMENKEMQDQILLKADGFPTYNFAHVIDDHLMNITYVVRGSEYLTSTPKYVLLYDAFGWERPHYVHLPLLMGQNPDGTTSKLSKRHGAVSFQDLVNMGYLPDAIVNYIAFLGWSPKDSDQEIFSLDELKKVFSIDGIGKSASVFDYEKLKWFNSEYIKELPEEEFEAKTLPMLKEVCPDYVDVKKLAGLLHSRVDTLNEVKDKVGFITERLPMDLSLYTNKKNKTTPESCGKILKDVLPRLEALTDWNNDSLFALLKGYATEAGIKAGAVMWAVRIAVARQAVTPGGATELMEVLGRDESLSRIEQAVKEIEEA
ncbi:MAG: glutamate--tRNA ligase [Lachnospiraceae bacterium]|nr:glutamate--tRNA ligase [Lachnospiraceae bacterium]